MRLATAAATAAIMFVFAAPSHSAEIYKDYVLSKEVYDMIFVHVFPNRLDDYLDGMKQTWWSSWCQAEKKDGAAIDCQIYASTTMDNRDFNVVFITKRPSAAMSDPDEARYNAVMADTRKKLTEDKQKSLVAGYNEMRTIFGQQIFRQLTFK